MRGTHRFHPHRLPNARRSGVEEPGGAIALLADREWVGFVAVLHPHGHLLRARVPQRAGDVRAELGVPAFVVRHLLVVHPDGRDLVHCAKVQQHTLPGPGRRQLEDLAVPHLVVVALDTGQCRLRGIRDQDLLVVRVCRGRCRQGGAFGPPRVTPHAVEVQPTGPCHLRARVFGQRVVRSHQVSPRRGQGWRLRLPGHYRVGRRVTRHDDS